MIDTSSPEGPVMHPRFRGLSDLIPVARVNTGLCVPRTYKKEHIQGILYVLVNKDGTVLGSIWAPQLSKDQAAASLARGSHGALCGR